MPINYPRVTRPVQALDRLQTPQDPVHQSPLLGQVNFSHETSDTSATHPHRATFQIRGNPLPHFRIQRRSGVSFPPTRISSHESSINYTTEGYRARWVREPSDPTIWNVTVESDRDFSLNIGGEVYTMRSPGEPRRAEAAHSPPHRETVPTEREVEQRRDESNGIESSDNSGTENSISPEPITPPANFLQNPNPALIDTFEQTSRAPAPGLPFQTSFSVRRTDFEAMRNISVSLDSEGGSKRLSYSLHNGSAGSFSWREGGCSSAVKYNITWQVDPDRPDTHLRVIVQSREPHRLNFNNILEISNTADDAPDTIERTPYSFENLVDPSDTESNGNRH